MRHLSLSFFSPIVAAERWREWNHLPAFQAFRGLAHRYRWPDGPGQRLSALSGLWCGIIAMVEIEYGNGIPYVDAHT